MSNTYTGTGGASGLEVRTIDLATDLFGIDIIEVSNGTLTPGASPNIAVIATGGGGGGGVTTIGFGSTGLTPAGATGGAVTVAGTLVAANGGTSFNTYAQGDIIYASAVNTLAKLTAGADTEVLTLAGGVPTWAAPTGGIGGTIAAGQVAYGTALDTIGGDTGLTYTSTPGSRRLKIEDSSAGTMFEVKSTDGGGGSAPDVVFVRDSASPAAGDDLGVVVFKGNNTLAAEQEFARISAEANAVGAGAENGQLDFRVFNAGNIGSQLRITEGGVFVNIANDASTDFRVDTLSTNDALRVNAANDTVSFGVNVLPYTIMQQTTGTAGLTIQIDDDGATASPDIKLFHNSTSPAANDDLGHIHFQGRNLAPATLSYTDFYADILDPTVGVEAGRFNFRVRSATNAGSLTDMFVIRGDNNPCVVVNDSGRADVDFRVETDAQSSAFLMDASANTATFNVPVTAAATSISAGTTVSAGTSVSATTTVTAGTGVSTTNGPISAGGATGAVTANTTVTGATGVIATTGGVLASAGGVTATLGDITAAAGDITAALGNIDASAGTISAAQDITSTGGDITAALGNITAAAGYASTVAGQRYGGDINTGADLANPNSLYYGGVWTLTGDTYTLGGDAIVSEPGATATFLCSAAITSISVAGGVAVVIGGGASGTGFTCPQFESFTIYCIDPASFFIFGNVTVL